jgi:hypothetical protein
MGKILVSGGLVAALLLFASAARSDVSSADSQAAPGDPPHVVPAAIGQTDPGPASALWHYPDLSPGEQAYVDRNANTAGWDQIDAAYGAAVAEQALAAAARDEANQLGVDDLASEGVVP